MKLTDDQKAFIVVQYAMYRQPLDVCREFRDHFGVELPHEQARAWAPHKKAGCTSAKWIELFNATRKRYFEELTAIPITQLAHRMHKLNEMLDEAMSPANGRKNPRLALDILERAAKEMGGLYTNQRVVAGKVEHVVTDEPDMSIDEKRNLLADKLSEALTRATSAAALLAPGSNLSQ